MTKQTAYTDKKHLGLLFGFSCLGCLTLTACQLPKELFPETTAYQKEQEQKQKKEEAQKAQQEKTQPQLQRQPQSPKTPPFKKVTQEEQDYEERKELENKKIRQGFAILHASTF